MALFDAGDAVQEMEWDFTRYGGGKGIVPEPSDVQMERFLRKWNVLVTQVAKAAVRDAAKADALLIDPDWDTPDPQTGKSRPPRILTLQESIEVMKKLDITGSDSSIEVSEAMLDLVAQLCKGSPSKAQIKKLPNRVRGAFYGWLVGQLTNPEFSAAVTKPSLKVVNGG